MKLLVTGANGQLGSELKKLSPQYTEYDFDFHDVETLDLTDFDSLEKYLNKTKPAYIINCAAYTAVDKAETDKDTALLINGDMPGKLANLAQKINAICIHVSTDFVFGGDKSSPYTEEDKPQPLSVYAQSKMIGEKNVLACNNTLVVRTSWLYSSFGGNFVKTILRLAKEKDQLGIVFDQVGTPTYAADLADAILKIIPKIKEKGITALHGLYHYSNEGVASWYDFAWEIVQAKNLSCKINPIFSYEYPLPAQRPSFSLMSKKKIKDTFNLEIPHWKASLKKCLKQIP